MLPPLTTQPPEFTPTEYKTEENLAKLNINQDGFLWPEEEKLFRHIMVLNEQLLAFTDE